MRPNRPNLLLRSFSASRVVTMDGIRMIFFMLFSFVASITHAASQFAPNFSVSGRPRRLQETLTEAVKMIQADRLDLGPRPPLLCVADSGYALGHPDLPTRPQVDGSDMTLQNGKVLRWDEDLSGHGTASAGVVAAVEGNSVGYVGVAPGIRLFITRALDDNGKADMDQLIDSIQQCVDAGAKIISMSLGCSCTDLDHCEERGCFSNKMRAYFSQLNDNGHLIFGAAGNEGTEDEFFFPGSFDSVISVGGVDKDWIRFDDSSMHNQVELSAAAAKVETTFVKRDTGEFSYTESSGTSLAVPAVAASAALIWSHFPECTNHQIRTALARAAWNPNRCDKRLGFGIVQVRDAFDLLRRYGCELDGQIFRGESAVCDGYATFAPTKPPIFARPTFRPTQRPQSIRPISAATDDASTMTVTWWMILILVAGAVSLGFIIYYIFSRVILPKCCKKR